MSVSKRNRFEVFKRDRFCCQYCGKRPPDTVLECDHIRPACEGGSDDFDNLITSCFDCNRGKGGTPLGDSKCEQVQEVQLEQIAQLTAFNQMLIESIERQKDQSEWLFSQVSERLGMALSDEDKNSIRTFASRISFDKILEAAAITGSKSHCSLSVRWKYFCGVCWRMVRETE